MKKIATALLFTAAMGAVAGNVDVEWEVVGHAPTQEWRTAYTQRFTLRGDLARLKGSADFPGGHTLSQE